jgi:hypothetical protein
MWSVSISLAIDWRSEIAANFNNVKKNSSKSFLRLGLDWFRDKSVRLSSENNYGESKTKCTQHNNQTCRIELKLFRFFDVAKSRILSKFYLFFKQT